MIAHNFCIPADNIYNTLQRDFLELANRNNRQKDEGMAGNIHGQFDAMTSMEIRGEISEYLVEASKNYYKKE